MSVQYLSAQVHVMTFDPVDVWKYVFYTLGSVYQEVNIYLF